MTIEATFTGIEGESRTTLVRNGTKRFDFGDRKAMVVDWPLQHGVVFGRKFPGGVLIQSGFEGLPLDGDTQVIIRRGGCELKVKRTD